MRVLVLTDENPFPPRSGNTIPIAGTVEAMRRLGHLVDVETIGEYGTLNLECKKKRGGSAVFHELAGVKPIFLHWECSNVPTDKIEAYDVVLASPYPIVGVAQEIVPAKVPIIAYINDVYTAVLASATVTGLSGRGIAQWATRRMRSMWMDRAEAAGLRSATAVVVQTEKDQEWLRRVGGEELMAKSVAISNGVPDSLFEVPPIAKDAQPRALFVANFRSLFYRLRLKWFLRQVWPGVKMRLPYVGLDIVGQGLETKQGRGIIREIIQYGGTYREYVPDLNEVYEGATVSVAPVFKGYGFINKVAESLAAGRAVVGDHTAFNGLGDVLGMGGGVVATSPEEWQGAIVSLLGDPQHAQAAGRIGRLYAKENLRWASKEQQYKNLLSMVLRGSQP